MAISTLLASGLILIALGFLFFVVSVAMLNPSQKRSLLGHAILTTKLAIMWRMKLSKAARAFLVLCLACFCFGILLSLISIVT